MDYVDAFRNGRHARHLAERIAAEVQPGRNYRLMEFCGGHTHAIFRYGLPDLLPTAVQLMHGPGCPVCIMPMGRIDMAIELAHRPGTLLCTYGDMLRVPGSGHTNLQKARAEGANVRMLYSPLEALQLAEANPGFEVVFFAIGFETTTPPTALVLEHARQRQLSNFSVLCNHVQTPPAMHAILNCETPLALDGFIGPAHVSTVIGSAAYDIFPRHYHKPVVIAGFEPVDMLQAILQLVRQLNSGRAEVENEFSRAVTPQGNLKAQALMEKVFGLRARFEWRGLGSLPNSALQIRSEYAPWDAEQRFALETPEACEHKGCECAAILRGLKAPRNCRLFARSCTPDTPLGACMVSSEGACAAYYHYGRQRQE